MQRFLKGNSVLLIGIALPTLLIIMFGLGAHLPQKLIPPPKFDLLYMTNPYPHDGVSAVIVENKLKIFITPEVRKGTLPMPRLFRFDVATQTSKEIPISLPTIHPNIADKKLANTSQSAQPTLPTLKEELQIAELQNLNLSSADIAPDGYKAEFSSPNQGGAISFLISNSYKRSLIISKNGKVIPVIKETNNTYGDKSIKFLGWIVQK